MLKRKNLWHGILLTICFTIAISGCGMNNSSNQSEGREEPVMGDGKKSENPKRPEHQQNGIAAGRIESALQLQETQNEKGILFRYTLKNQTEKEKEFHFSTSQKFDYVIKDSNGKVIYQYSKNHMFMQVLSSLRLKQGDTFKQDLLVKNLEPGSYELEVWLTPKGETEDYRQKITFKWQ
ncbi:BsuPI-related putative proteinase inhibitor [Bacillus sp. NEB1478]|uniref:BsuPI-related putative proteinase inhibitor n=1 Tax=Bacillus sp. NEB1478 TaxID=3073816 RepID=UPI0028738E33|nr:BsuPI-related putative proteinase inhibitor [Bacillus sp. NEB1478]WNB91313.1 BsuPI-related putative proteinase inhibitor [Bacillus sp. NEB1478]